MNQRRQGKIQSWRPGYGYGFLLEDGNEPIRDRTFYFHIKESWEGEHLPSIDMEVVFTLGKDRFGRVMALNVISKSELSEEEWS